jgi:hypothetical protein
MVNLSTIMRICWLRHNPKDPGESRLLSGYAVFSLTPNFCRRFFLVPSRNVLAPKESIPRKNETKIKILVDAKLKRSIKDYIQ